MQCALTNARNGTTITLWNPQYFLIRPTTIFWYYRNPFSTPKNVARCLREASFCQICSILGMVQIGRRKTDAEKQSWGNADVDLIQRLRKQSEVVCQNQVLARSTEVERPQVDFGTVLVPGHLQNVNWEMIVKHSCPLVSAPGDLQ